jgi:cell division protein ZapA
MSAIRDGGKVKARERIAVLAALNLAFELAQRPARASADGAASGADANLAAVDLDGLIRRVDMALGADGQLL